MHKEPDLTANVLAAQKNVHRADELIRAYLPFIRAEASRTMGHFCTEQDDGFSIAMMAFHEALLSYEPARGGFLAYAAMRIRSRLLDQQRRENRDEPTLSLDEPTDQDDRTLGESLADPIDPIAEQETRAATRQEILELAAVMQPFGVSFSDVADNCPKQQRTLDACAAAIRYAAGQPELLDELLRTKKLPMAKLVKGSGAERKTLERHRNYLLVMLLIQTNGYEIMRGHLKRVLRKGGQER